jgi:subtilisin family serine protease
MKYMVLRKTVQKSAVATAAIFQHPREAFSAGDLRLAEEDLTPAQFAETKRDPAVHVAAPLMPVTLISPFASAAAMPAANWGVQAIGADKSKYTGAGVRMAVFDTGIDQSHDAFTGVNLIQQDFTGDGNGDVHGHGTHCAGTIFGRDVNGQRIGVAPGITDVLIGKVLNNKGMGDSKSIFDAMLWALQERAHVISMSIGFDFPGMVNDYIVNDGWQIERASAAALRAFAQNLRMFDSVMGLFKNQSVHGSAPIVIAASGNDSKREISEAYCIEASLPSAASGVISVGAVKRAGPQYAVADFSNSMPTVSAPGVDILSAKTGGGLMCLNGTSMACPHVAGALALWLENFKNTSGDLRGQLATAKLIGQSRQNVFVSGTGQDDVGAGLVQVP